jgi:hypothetical protein
MSKMLLTLVLLGMVGGAWADPNDLSGGVLIAHQVPICYCLDDNPTPNCECYYSYAIDDLSEVDAQLPDDETVTWFVLAAWESEAKTWCGTEFGFSAYSPAAFTYYAIEPCYPATGGLEIPTANWPGPLQGTAFVTTGDPWTGNYVPLYWFGGRAYFYYGPAVIQIDVDPPTGFCGFSNCSNPPLSFTVPPVGRGGMGIGMPGVIPQFQSEEPWACCVPYPPWCFMTLEQECLLSGGIWHEGENCGERDCPEMWACCIAGVCQMMFEENCTLVGGTWMQGIPCDPNPCPAVCCFQMPTSPHGCEIMLEAACAAASGFWHPEWVTCDPNPCEIYTPVENASWGQIKSMYQN